MYICDKWILKKKVMMMCLDSSGLVQGSVVDSCENVNDLSGSINDGVFLDQLSDY
jgi:hypothetical protein